MKIIDLHCDTIPKLAEVKNQKLYKNNLGVDIEKMKASNYKAEFFSLFLDKNHTKEPFGTANSLYYLFIREINDNSEYIAQARSYKDLMSNEEKNKISAFLTLEGGEALEGKLSNFYDFYEKGVRLITLTWNYKNEIGFPNYNYEFRENGLTGFGKELVEAMNEKKVIIDVSHLSDAGFFDVAEISRSPFVASHSNARSITEHPRNLNDDMIKVLANKGGIMGINFYNKFLGDEDTSKISSMINHINHIYKIGGSEVISIGTDFDGIDCDVEVRDASQMDKLYLALKKEKYSDEIIDKIFYKNAENLIKEML